MGRLQTMFQDGNRLTEIGAPSPGIEDFDEILNI
jgi:hypothetical protein